MASSRFADIILPLALESSFTYKIPDNLEDTIKKGSRVLVSFGSGRQLTGLVEKIHDNVPVKGKLKNISGVPEYISSLTDTQFLLLEWLSEYYLCTKGEVLDALLPANLKKSDRYLPRTNPFISLAGARSEKEMVDLFDALSKSPAQTKLLSAWLEMKRYETGQADFSVQQTYLMESTGISQQVLSAMIKKGIFRRHFKEVPRMEGKKENRSTPSKLTPIQEKALNEIRTNLSDGKITLLHGVTSSGKTELYIHLIRETIKEGRQVLYLLPEIALTTQIINRLTECFGDRAGVYHSRLSANEKVEVWRRLSGEMEGLEYDIILGVRSSLFLPFKSLGLVIVDEEHDNSYKQTDPAPRYNARDVATLLGRMSNAKVLLGSATPSVETMYNARQGKYGYVRLNERFGKVKLPEIIISDTADAYRRKIMISHFTPELLDAIGEAVKRKKQVIILRNRRGFSPFLQCSDCGWIPTCRNCAVSLTYHKNSSQMICHYCGHKEHVPGECSECHSQDILTKGFGTEKVEDELKVLFPEAVISRMDSDSTRRKGVFEKILRELEAGKTDILLGTQMISKGLDIDELTLVGILGIDNMLHAPDFRAHEKSYQLLEQVSGRAGRRNEKGRVIILTSEADHPVIRHVLSHDYEGMYNSQIEERKEFGYPPFSRLVRIYIKHPDRDQVRRYALEIAAKLRRSFGERVLGPEFPTVSRIQSNYIMTILIKIEKSKNQSGAKKILKMAIDSLLVGKDRNRVRIYPDVDPL